MFAAPLLRDFLLAWVCGLKIGRCQFEGINVKNSISGKKEGRERKRKRKV
jgi:hypothetical protein